MGDMVPRDPDDNPFVDNEAIRDLSEKIVDVLRPIGLTINPDELVFAVHPEFGMTCMIPALVRNSAKEKMDDDKASREEFNKMMANTNEAMIEDKADEIMKMVDADNFEDLFLGDAEIESECSHERKHPSTGHCLDCGKGLTE
jgi:hypothetical protein